MSKTTTLSIFFIRIKPYFILRPKTTAAAFFLKLQDLNLKRTSGISYCLGRQSNTDSCLFAEILTKSCGFLLWGLRSVPGHKKFSFYINNPALLMRKAAFITIKHPIKQPFLLIYLSLHLWWSSRCMSRIMGLYSFSAWPVLVAKTTRPNFIQVLVTFTQPNAAQPDSEKDTQDVGSTLQWRCKEWHCDWEETSLYSISIIIVPSTHLLFPLPIGRSQDETLSEWFSLGNAGEQGGDVHSQSQQLAVQRTPARYHVRCTEAALRYWWGLGACHIVDKICS